MSEHPLAGEKVTLLVDGEEEEYELEENISQQEGDDFIHSILGVDVAEPPTVVKHPEFEFAETQISEHSEIQGLRTVCRIDGCECTEVFETLGGIKDSDWTEMSMDKGILTDRTDLHYAYCPGHSLQEDEGYEPENDMASHDFNGGVPNAVRRELDE